MSNLEDSIQSLSTSTYVDLEFAKKEANQLLSGDKANNELKKNLLLKKNLYRSFVYIHISVILLIIYMSF